MKKRRGKEYYKNEARVMELLGMKQVPGSGNGWISKEDGENEEVLAQLKSTDKNSITVDHLEIEKLLYHAAVCKKLPAFIIQFLKSDDIFLLIKPVDLVGIVKFLETGVYEDDSNIDVPIASDLEAQGSPKKMIKSGNRGKYWNKRQKEYEKKGSKK